jgi:hypothetical protein
MIQRTKHHINKDLADNELAGAIINLYEKYSDLTVGDVCQILSNRLRSEIISLNKYYDIIGKEEEEEVE